MPELPEVETLKRGLSGVLVGLIIKNAHILAKPPFDEKYKLGDIVGAKITSTDRLAKLLIIHLDNKKSLLFHLKLTGQLIYHGKNEKVAGGHPIPPVNRPVPNSTTHVVFTFTDGSKLYFNDLRRFGWIITLPTEKIHELEFSKKLGPDPFDEKVTPKKFHTLLLKRKKTPVKTALMDQTVIAGVGNIYSDEALWLAKIHPKRLVGSLTENEVEATFTGLRHALEVAIEQKGSSDNTYVTHKGEAGLFLNFANAYHRTGLPCKRCGGKIIREKINGRSAHYCPNCQKLVLTLDL